MVIVVKMLQSIHQSYYFNYVHYRLHDHELLVDAIDLLDIMETEKFCCGILRPQITLPRLISRGEGSHTEPHVDAIDLLDIWYVVPHEM